MHLEQRERLGEVDLDRVVLVDAEAVDVRQQSGDLLRDAGAERAGLRRARGPA